MPLDVGLGTLTLSDAQLEALINWGLQNADEKTALSADINNSTVTIPTTGGLAGVGVNDLIAIDGEILLVTAKSAPNLTATRAQITTTAAAHVAGAKIRRLQWKTLKDAIRTLAKRGIDGLMDESTVAAIAAQRAIIDQARATIQALKDAGGV